MYISIFMYVVPQVPRLELEALNDTIAYKSVMSVLVHIGTQVVISCKATENDYTGGNLQIWWSSDADIGNKNVSIKRKSLTEVCLIIDSVGLQHAGEYSCHAMNNINSTSISVSLVVIRATLSLKKDNYSINPREIVQPIDSVAKIRCVYKPAPDSKISWGVEKSGIFSFILSDNSTNIKVSSESKALIFDPVSQDHEGNYFFWSPCSVQRSLELVVGFVPPIATNQYNHNLRH